jgi:hypothetical protein
MKNLTLISLYLTPSLSYQLCRSKRTVTGLVAALNSAATPSSEGGPNLAKALPLIAITESPTAILPEAFAKSGRPSASSRNSATSMLSTTSDSVDPEPLSRAVRIIPIGPGPNVTA